MPRYSFVTEDGEQVEHICSWQERPETITLDDGRVAKFDFAAQIRSQMRPATKGWPMTCYASGVHASQAEDLRQYFRQHGCPTEVTNSGDVVYTSAAHRKRALKCRGMRDRSSFC